jgi:folate-binding Fe-S cluster repair protein YgfZ
VLFDLSDRSKLRLRGDDRLRFLNGQVTNDVRKANANLSMAACVLNAK